VSLEENPDLEEYFAQLLTVDGIDELLTHVYAREPRPPTAIRMGRDGVIIPPDAYLGRSDGALAEVDVERVLALHRDGASIIINGVEQAVEPIAELCEAIERTVGMHAHANVYLTPREAQGFPLHFDPHDVFLLQFAGAKEWTMYPSSVPLANSEARSADELEPQGPPTRIRLRAGELLYMPRGLLHEGITTEEMSAHLTIGMNPYTWAQLIHDTVEALEADDVDFRRSVPTDRDSGAFEETLALLAAKLTGSARNPGSPRTNGAGRRRLRGLLTQIHEPERIRLDTVVRLRAGVAPEIRPNGAGMALEFGDAELTLPAFVEPHLRALCSDDPIRAADLPPTLDDEGKLVLVRRLVREGLLVPADAC